MADVYLDLDDEKRDLFAVKNMDLYLNPTTAKVEDREDGGAILKAGAVLLSNISSHKPSSMERPLPGRVTPAASWVEELEAQNERLESHIETLEEIEESISGETFEFPNLAWEALKAGLYKEQLTNAQLNIHIKEAEKHQKNIDLLLDFSAELTAHKKGSNEMSENMKRLLGELKEQGIDLWKSEDMNVNDEKISELKSLSSSQVDKLRSNLQIIFTTKIQVLVQSIGAIMETLKDIIRNNTKLINAANRLPGH